MTTQTEHQSVREASLGSSPKEKGTKEVVAESPDIPLMDEHEAKENMQPSRNPVNTTRVTRQALLANPQAFVGHRIAKTFDGAVSTGSVTSCKPAATHDGEPRWDILYEADGDGEDFDADEMVFHINRHQIYTSQMTKEALCANPDRYRMRRVAVTMPDLTVRFGTVTSFRKEPLAWRVFFDDGQREELNAEDVANYLRNYEKQCPVFSNLNEDLIRSYPMAFLNHRVAKKFRNKLVVGTVIKFHLTRGGKHIWTIQYDIGSHGDEEYTAKDMITYMQEYNFASGEDEKMGPTTLKPRPSLKRKLDEMDTIDILEFNPKNVLKARVAQYFGAELYFGTVVSFLPPDKEVSEALWHVLYDDKDEEDLTAEELIDLMSLYRKNKGEDNAGSVRGQGWEV